MPWLASSSVLSHQLLTVTLDVQLGNWVNGVTGRWSYSWSPVGIDKWRKQLEQAPSNLHKQITSRKHYPYTERMNDISAEKEVTMRTTATEEMFPVIVVASIGPRTGDTARNDLDHFQYLLVSRMSPMCRVVLCYIPMMLRLFQLPSFLMWVRYCLWQ